VVVCSIDESPIINHVLMVIKVLFTDQNLHDLNHGPDTCTSCMLTRDSVAQQTHKPWPVIQNRALKYRHAMRPLWPFDPLTWGVQLVCTFPRSAVTAWVQSRHINYYLNATKVLYLPPFLSLTGMAFQYTLGACQSKSDWGPQGSPFNPAVSGCEKTCLHC